MGYHPFSLQVVGALSLTVQIEGVIHLRPVQDQ